MNSKKTNLLLFLFLFLLTSTISASDKVQSYKLANGLTVILSPDPDASDVYGIVAVNAGSYHEPKDATGLAHYLEHVLFKGTQEIGTTNWEAEKESYQKIIQLFEDLRATEDEAEKKRISKEINELSIEAGKYTVSNDFSNLIQGIGGTGLNAGTSYDLTYYHNSFPSFQLERWLEIYANRFIKPVFRGFQAELENVYEEKNMYADNRFSVLREMFNESAFGPDNPYGRSIIGTTEHLKNPSMRSLIEFYEKNYVASNMALILSGNFDVEKAKTVIERTFGKWEKKDAPVAKTFPARKFDGKEVVKVKSSPLPVGFWAYNAVKSGHEDELALEVMTSILSNRNETGLLDKLALDGDLLSVSAYSDARKYAGNIVVQAIPTFNIEMMKYNSLSSIEKLMRDEFDKIKEGNFEDWLLESVKKEMIVNFTLLQESPRRKGMLLMQLFNNGEDIDSFDKYVARVNAITKQQVVDVAKKYLTKNYLKFYSLEGTTSKDKIKKPGIKPIEPSSGQKSKFAKYIETVPIAKMDEKFIDFDKDVQQQEIAKGVKLYYTPNKKNDIFSLRIKFGAGSKKIPAIGLATSLMNSAGIMAQLKAHEVKREFSKLGCSYYFYNSDSYTYIELSGLEKNLVGACKLLSKLYLIPALDEKQMDRVLGQELGNRYIEKKQKDAQFDALVSFIRYGENSPFLNRISTADVKTLTLSSLAAKFIEATHYETSVHYVGKLPLKEVKQKLLSSLAFPSGLKHSESPYIRPLNSPDERIIYFIHDKEATQSNIVLFSKSDNYSHSKDAVATAFNQYFSGGFNGIVLQELRELRSFAYSASASYISPIKENTPAYLIGSIGTQADKTTDALSEFLKLIDKIPEKPERMTNIKNYLIQNSLSSTPSFRLLSLYIESLETQGYKEDPAKTLIPEFKNLTFQQIIDFYNKDVQGRPLAIAIVGNKKEIDMDALKSIAKVKKMHASKLFKD